MYSKLLAEQHSNKDTNISNELRKLLCSLGTPKKIEKDEYLYHEGSDAQEIFLIQSGLVHITLLTSDGKELSMRICKSGDIFGELTLFTNNPKYLLSARALQKGVVLLIDKEKLEQELMTNSALTFEFMRWVSDHMRKFQSKIRDLLLNGKKGALYSTLIRLSNSYGKANEDGLLIDIAMTNQELANFCAATRESVNRMLAELRTLNVISIQQDGKILIKNVQFLRDEIGCDNCPIEVCNIN
ncbi:Crp/Fnr family transcriptional regulator [Virgibacillus sp. LDC-1]|uniref:Crp/Fnr family transcriptional regulator n=1 Tax=Virgibacillus sp. LDC-1 TaxID=3039856 RepID=UPI0024DE7DDB|nr:Crp/Fnr family transcriptional regulator [Virgibacillus sp. LDC-1]